ncbi:uncharacterized protein [Chelonus insularis]|uniref:uncharacterized protein n=1 Tax=Chelonus insularis TaxID=460826 RepID=UPI00158C6EE8|nr:uncharacterized protein LOC118065355 [Chelonus insularis]
MTSFMQNQYPVINISHINVFKIVEQRPDVIVSIVDLTGDDDVYHDQLIARVEETAAAYPLPLSPVSTLSDPSQPYLVDNRGNIVGVIPRHEHAGDIAAVQSKIIKAKVVKKAKRNDAKPSIIISSVLRGVLSPVSALLPKLASMTRTVNRIRCKNNPQLLDPPSRSQLELRGEWKQTHKGDMFLLHDSGGNKKRFLVFSTPKNLDVLKKCQQWLSDGTFNAVPSIFSQLYTVHGFIDGKSIPLVYALLPNKSKKIYLQFLTVLRQNMPNFSPSLIMVDFEPAFIEAFREVFKSTKITGCNFHFNQCFRRRIQSCGLQSRYNQDVIFAANLRLLMALAFIPPKDVIEGYELIVGCDFYKCNSDDLEDLLAYFEMTWIGQLCHNKKKRKKPLFDISMLNCYQAVINDLLRSNNPIEGWHSGFNRRVGVSHASIGLFLNKLKDEQSRNEALISQIDTGLNVVTQPKTYRDYNVRLKKVVMNYDSSDKLGYLRSIAKIISINARR